MPVTDPMATDGAGTGTGWSVRDGLATLDEPTVLLMGALDAVFTRWATADGARQQSYPPLLRAEDLRTLDYFQNFPHLGNPVTRIRPDRLADRAAAQPEATTLPAVDLADATHLLPSAACYGCFLHLSGTSTDSPLLITTVAQCFRNEDHHDGLRRLWAFTMREIVCVGSADAVRAHLDRHHERIATFGSALGLTLDRQPATDPFFEKDSSRTLMQMLAPVKDEYLYVDATAVASTNNHRNFFGERRGISHAGRPAFTGCVAFGLERWVHALGDLFEGDLAAANRAVRRWGERS